MKIHTLTGLSAVLVLVAGCNQNPDYTSSDQPDRTSRVESDNSAAPTPTSRDATAPDRVYADGQKAADKAADNTGKNVRDRSAETITPGDQAENETDRNLTRDIRKQLVAADQLSINAKNIKVITINGKVTLRGPVNSEEEHQRIVTMAKAMSGVADVDDQLEVKETK